MPSTAAVQAERFCQTDASSGNLQPSHQPQWVGWPAAGRGGDLLRLNKNFAKVEICARQRRWG